MMYQAQKQSGTPCVLSLPKHSYCLLLLLRYYSQYIHIIIIIIIIIIKRERARELRHNNFMGQGESVLCNFAEHAPMPKGIENPEKEELTC